MKLTNQQITALATKIHNELEEVRKKEIKSSEEARSKFIQSKLVLKGNVVLKEFWDYNKATRNTYHNDNIEKFLMKKYDNEFKKIVIPKNKIIYYEDIKNDIIIETIEADNIDDLIKKIKNKYK